jgi:3-deoxy-D-manno-octulosonate 8-phosphate phosphatase (KDO 8-P phosphatase)
LILINPVATTIKWVGFDIDGVMTDGGIYLDNEGREFKRFHSRDGHALKLLVRTGIKVAIITGRQSEIVSIRAKELGLTEIYQGVKNKLTVYQEILKQHNLRPEETAFAGDDLVDLPILCRCGLPMSPADGCPEILSLALFVSSAKAGHGAVRQMVEYILKGQGLWDELIRKYLA